MSEQDTSKGLQGEMSREEMMSALFANLVLQQANMAMMFLGKVPHPQTGKETVDLEAAQLFIDNLEMIKLKTQGNLNQNEEGLLKQSLMNAQMTFVEVADKAPAKSAEKQEPASAAPSTQPAPSAATDAQPKSGGSPSADASTADAETEARRKFVKKY